MQLCVPTRAQSLWVTASILLLSILCAAPAQAQEFGDQFAITTSADSAQSVHAADLDGDGDQDILAAIYGEDTIAWYENFGGEFGSRQVLTETADQAWAVTAADIDGDGDQDVLFSSIGDNSRIAWFENTGGGSFSGENVIGGYAQGIHASDLDGDGDVDVLLADLARDEVGWLENAGDGSFSSRQVINSNAERARSVYTADVDGDGDQDVISGALDGDNVVWQENTGGGVFSSPNVITTNANGTRSVYATDLDLDGDPDVLSASSFDNKIAWYENTGGSFSSQRVITTDISSASVVHGVDADGDGDEDVVSASYNGTVAWYENFSGEFGSEQVITSNADWATGLASADLDGDHDSELISSSRDDDKVAWYTNLGTDGIAPSAPTGLQATGVEGAVDLNWDENAETDVVGYNVYRSTSSFFEKANATQINGSVVKSADYADRNVSPSTTYYYRVTAVDKSGNESSLSSEANAVPQEDTPPAAPTNLQATAGEGQVDLGWDANTENDLSGYHVYRSTASFQEVANATQLTDLVVENASFTDTGVSNGTKYYYRVTAVDTSGNESAGSNEASATPSDQTPPSAPTNLVATGGDGKVGLGWDANTEGDLSGYHVYRSTSSFQEVANATQLTDAALENASFTDTGVSNGTQYYYRVTAVDTSGNESAGSNEASAVPTANTPPAAPSGLQATGLDSTVTLGWDANSEEDLAGYHVYRSTSSFQELANASRLNDSVLEVAGYADTSVTNGTEYFYRVTAVDSSDNESAASSEVSAIPRPPPVAHTEEATNVKSTSAVLQGRVDPNGKETTVIFEYYPTGLPDSSKGVLPQNNPLTGTEVQSVSAPISGLDPETEYTFQVFASSNSGGDTGGTRTFTTTAAAPSVPTNLTATAGDGQVDLGWDANTDNDVAGYHVYRSTASFQEVANATQLTDATLQNASYTDTGVSNGTQYYYRVTAVDTSGNESAGSNEASATPRDQTPPAAPTSLQATAGNGQVDLGWEENTENDLAGYHVYRSTASFQEVANATQLTDAALENASYTDTGVSNGTQYYYRVTAVDSSGNESAGSNEARATPKGLPTAQTRDATNVTGTGAILQGRVNPAGSETTVTFEYYPSGQSGQAQTVTAQESPLTGTTDQAVSAGISGLDPNTEYTFTAIAENSAGSDTGEPRTFTTQGQVPSVITESATNVTVTGAQFNGSVNPNGSETSVVFNYQPIRTGGAVTVEAAESPLTGNQPQSVHATVSDLQPDTEYAVQVVATNFSGTQSGETTNFTTPPLEISLARSVQTPQNGSAFDVTASLSEGFDPSEVARLYYRKVGASSFQSTAFEAVDATTYSATIPGSAVTERGVEYYARFSDGAIGGSVPETEPSVNPRYAPVRVSRLTAGVGLEANAYRMISAPVRLDTSDAVAQLRDDFGSVDRSVWRLLRWNPETGSYDEATTEGGSGTLVPGRAFWLITREGETRDGNSTFDVGAGRSVSPEPISIELPPGWSQVANPRSYPVAWSSVSGRASVMDPVSYDPAAPDSADFDVQFLDPWTGYWVFNPSESPVQIGVPASAAGQGSSVASTAHESHSQSMFGGQADYSLAFTARLEREGRRTLRDAHTVVGVGPSGRAGVGVEDVADPPPVGEYLRVDIMEEKTRLAGSLRPTGQDGYEWNLTVSAADGEPILGTVEGELDVAGSLPPGFERRLMDVDTGREIPISGGTFSVQLTDEYPTRHLRLIVGTESYTEAESAEIRPDATALRAVYPNPSDGPVSVDYQLENAQRVQIRVYDLLGRVVKTLVDERRPAGHHTVQWNAGAGGTPVASGAYLVRMKTEATSVTQRVSIFR